MSDSTVLFDGMRVKVVEAGTVVRDDRADYGVTVNDITIAVVNGEAFCTQSTFAKIKKPRHSGANAPSGWSA